MGVLIEILKNLQYEVMVRCKNCGNKDSVKILKGMEVKDYLKYKSCNNCATTNLVN